MKKMSHSHTEASSTYLKTAIFNISLVNGNKNSSHVREKTSIVVPVAGKGKERELQMFIARDGLTHNPDATQTVPQCVLLSSLV